MCVLCFGVFWGLTVNDFSSFYSNSNGIEGIEVGGGLRCGHPLQECNKAGMGWDVRVGVVFEVTRDMSKVLGEVLVQCLSFHDCRWSSMVSKILLTMMCLSPSSQIIDPS